MKVNVQIRKANFGKGYDLFIDGEYQSYHDTIEDAEWEGRWLANKKLGIGSTVVKEFDVGDDDAV